MQLNEGCTVVTYRPERDITDQYLTKVAEWIDSSGEVLCMLSYIGRAHKNWALCHDFVEFKRIVDHVEIGTDITVFREPQLPLRGIVNDEFIRYLIQKFPDGVEWLYVSLERLGETAISLEGEIGDDVESLDRELSMLKGLQVAIGLVPDWGTNGPNVFVSAAKGGVDGPS